MRFVVGIVGHITRQTMIDQLSDQTDPRYISIDDGTLGCEGNHRKVWTKLASNSPNTEWIVVLEDDAQPVRDFTHQLEQALQVAPTDVVSLYLGRNKPTYPQPAIEALVKDLSAHWIVTTRLLHAVGVAIRTPLVPAMLAHIQTYPSCTRPIDEAIARWAVTTQRPVGYSWPSLVDHADTEPVILKRVDGKPRTPGRLAWRAGTRAHWDSSTAPLQLTR